MKKLSLLILLLFVAASVALAQSNNTYQSSTDILGAHNAYGRGCMACHAPHSGSHETGITPTPNTVTGGGWASDPDNGVVALWAQDLTPFYIQTYNFGGGSYPVTLPAPGSVNIRNGDSIVLLCLSCHDGVLTTVGMMTGHTVETLPIWGVNAPTLLGKQAPAAGIYENDHPVGPSAQVSCNGGTGGGTTGLPYSPPTTSSESGYDWDCIGGGASATPINPWAGPNMTQFATVNYKASFWNNVACTGTTSSATCKGNPLSAYAGTTAVNGVTCTTCHNQHSMNVYTNPNGSYQTMFFLRGYWLPTAGGNSVAQFCRNCHGSNANEMNNSPNVPTT